MKRTFLKYRLSVMLLACSLMLVSRVGWSDEQAQGQTQTQPQTQYHVDAGEGVKVFDNKTDADAYGKQAFDRFTEQEAQKAKDGGYCVDINGVKYGDPNAIKAHENLDQHTFVRPDGQLEYFPDDRETVLAEHKKFLAERKKKLQEFKEGMTQNVEDVNDPRQQEAVKAVDDQIKSVEKEGTRREAEITESVKYEVPKVLTSRERKED